eukprot:g4547.t1
MERTPLDVCGDGVVLRYRMYAGITSPYLNRGGLQKKFEARGERISAELRSEARKKEERWGAMELHKMFPRLIGPPKKRRDKKTMEAVDWGARPIDLAHDYNWGFMSVVDLSLNFPYEVEIKEKLSKPRKAIFDWSKSPEKFIKVRIKEMSLGHQGLDVRKESLQLLAERVPERFRKLDTESLKKEEGLLSHVPLVVFRALLRWASTGHLRYERKRTRAVHDALKVLGLKTLAKRVKQLEAQEAKEALKALKEPKAAKRKLGQMARAAAQKRKVMKAHVKQRR